MGRLLSGQGATEYLVLLAVVLVIALLGIALLGFFPGTASDAQISEGQIYWKSASPIAIIETDARFYTAAWTEPYLRVRNAGSYPIRITNLLSANGQSIGQFYINAGYPNPGYKSISDYFYMGPGEEKYLGYKSYFPALPEDREILFQTSASSSAHFLGGATSICSAAEGANAGTVQINGFGFEYVQYVEGQQITKRQIGTKPLMIRCS